MATKTLRFSESYRSINDGIKRATSLNLISGKRFEIRADTISSHQHPLQEIIKKRVIMAIYSIFIYAYENIVDLFYVRVRAKNRRLTLLAASRKRHP